MKVVASAVKCLASQKRLPPFGHQFPRLATTPSVLYTDDNKHHVDLRPRLRGQGEACDHGAGHLPAPVRMQIHSRTLALVPSVRFHEEGRKADENIGVAE